MTPVERAVADAHRREWAFVLAATARVTRDMDVAEECVQEAYATALRVWPQDGVPANPGAWLTTVARRGALDLLRRDKVFRSKMPLLVEPEEQDEVDPTGDEIPDDRLRLIFTCCHPVLPEEARVALTLRLVCGVATPDVASAFLVSESTMAARLTRAKKKIAAERVPYRVPSPQELPDRLDAVLTVIHLLFTTGHTAPSGADLVRADLVRRAVDLARLLRELMPDEREVWGLLALLLATDARSATRVDADGALVLLADQDRGRWDRAMIAEATRLATDAMRVGSPGRFTLQAAIAVSHASAKSYADTDWPSIRLLYDALATMWPSPVVSLNRAIATSMIDGPAEGLAEIDALTLPGYHYVPAARADLLRQLGRDADAALAYQEAITLVDNETERAFLESRLKSLGQTGAGGPPAPAGLTGRTPRSARHRTR